MQRSARCSSTGRRSRRLSTKSSQSVIAVASALRSSPSSMAISPKISPALKIVKTISLPLSEGAKWRVKTTCLSPSVLIIIAHRASTRSRSIAASTVSTLASIASRPAHVGVTKALAQIVPQIEQPILRGRDGIGCQHQGAARPLGLPEIGCPFDIRDWIAGSALAILYLPQTALNSHSALPRVSLHARKARCSAILRRLEVDKQIERGADR